MEKKKRDSPLKLVKINDAINLVNQEVNLIGTVLERREPKRCRNNDWICTLRIIDDSYQSPGFTVNVFSNTLEELPHIKNHEDMILFTRVKIKYFDGGNGVNGTCNKGVSSFALYERGIGEEFVRYQCTSNFHQYKNSRVNQALQSAFYRIKAHTVDNFSFLREIREGQCFNLLCKIVHVSEDMSTIFVWDGTDSPPASILVKGIEDKPFSSLSVHTFLSRDILLGFPTVGTILRVSLSSHQFHGVKSGEWVKLYHLLCKVDRGSWVGEVTDSTMVHPAQDDPLVEKIIRIYDKRISSKFGHIPFWSFPSSPGLTETDDNLAPFVTLMDIITFPKVTYKYRCIVRVLATYPWKVEDYLSDENCRNQVLLTLEDPTATLEAFLCDKDAEYFWGLGFKDKEMLKKKWNRLLGIIGSSELMAPRNPPWIECCILSYYTHKADPWKTRFYKIFGTRLLV